MAINFLNVICIQLKLKFIIVNLQVHTCQTSAIMAIVACLIMMIGSTCVAERLNWRSPAMWNSMDIDQIPDPITDWSQCHPKQIPDLSVNFSNQAWMCDPNGMLNKNDGRNRFHTFLHIPKPQRQCFMILLIWCVTSNLIEFFCAFQLICCSIFLVNHWCADVINLLLFQSHLARNWLSWL